MPIIGLTDRPAAFPQIGILRKGAPKPERGPGRDLDHFRFDTDDAEALAAFAAAYGPEPRAINVYLPYPTVDENLSAWQESYVAGGLKRRCDGQTCVLRQLPSGKYDQIPVTCPCAALPEDSKERCKPVGRLQVIIPELRRLAYVTAATTSIHDIKNLSAQLLALEISAGKINGIPLILRRTPVEISMPDQSGKRVRREKWLLSIEAAPRWVGLQLQAMEQAALPGRSLRALPGPTSYPALPAPASTVLAYGDEDEGAVIDLTTGEIDPDPTPTTTRLRTADAYLALGKRLKGYGLSSEVLRGVSYKPESITTMGEQDYAAVMDRMKALERDALQQQPDDEVLVEGPPL